jgi:ketosteroid isomerase-like protein
MPAENEEFLNKVDEKFLKDRNGFFLEYVADDIRWNIVGTGVITGKKNFLEEMKRQELENYPVITIKNVIIEGEYIIVESTGKNYSKTGKPDEPAYCDIYRLEDGKIRELTTYIVNTAKLE